MRTWRSLQVAPRLSNRPNYPRLHGLQVLFEVESVDQQASGRIYKATLRQINANGKVSKTRSEDTAKSVSEDYIEVTRDGDAYAMH